ncbi:hypothetical protein E1B28_007032 [Marasmius oreades]|uniref:CENP-V/GFA domain-containing protein n=1 Tax=Marasmius oreades TaxID=181124 RepID=A0A9P7S257_9AGAR|nr:uncharacterized protein E1B28_007032 [Marasmius oreades]KAG7093351.1 hypothetical protein E1B28_007032 [Marasmius oreades]
MTMSNTSTKRSTIRAGSCLCKRIKFKIHGDPFTFILCHCVNCKKASGTAFLSNLWFQEKNVIITEGSDLVKCYEDHDTASGNALRRHFCSNCGSTLFLRPSKEYPRSDIIMLHASTVDDPFHWQPRNEFHKDSKWSWVDVQINRKKLRSKL